jgi:serine/threonine-protein kinase
MEVLAEPWGIPPGFQKTVHVLIGVGLLVVLVLAWYHGHKGRQRVSGPELLMIALLLVICGGVVSLLGDEGGEQVPSSSSRPPSVESDRPSVAVLPFDNLSPDAGHAYFAGGLHDELLTQLAKVGGVKVISRTSVMEYATRTKPLREIAEELAVGAIVEGSVQVLGDRLRVNVQLIDAETDVHLWADRFDRTLDDAFAIQSQVAEQVVRAVGAVLRGTEERALRDVPTANPEAYRLYLQGLDYLGRLGRLEGDLASAQQLFEQALLLDPTFALAHARLSIVHGRMHWFGYDTSPDRLMAQRREADEALRVAPDLPQARLALALMHYYGRRDWESALAECELALEGLPSDAEVWERFGYIHRRMGNWDEAEAAFLKATELDPRGAQLWEDLAASTRLLTGRYADALEAYDRALTLAPDLRLAAVRKGRLHVLWNGDMEPLRTVLASLPVDAELGPEGSVRQQWAELFLWAREPDALLDLLREAPVSSFSSQNLLLPKSLFAFWAHRIRGDTESAGRALDSAFVQLESRIAEFPDDWRVHASRGVILALLGRVSDAVSEADWLERSVIYRDDSFLGPRLMEFRALILAEAGESALALREIERLVSGPSWLSRHTLRLDPRWDVLRELPRFRVLLGP